MEAMELLRRQSNMNTATSTSSSLSGLISTLVPALVIAVVFVLLFLVLRGREQRTYAPRTYLGSLREQERTPPQQKGLLGWYKSMGQLPDTYVLQHNSLDAYFLLRYLKISVVICFVGCCITWPVLFPINALGGGGGSQLDILTYGNVSKSHKNYHYAHVFVAWAFISFVFFMVTREHIFYINLRQAYLLSPLYAARISSRTVLFTSVPLEYANDAKIRRMFGGKIKNVWISSNCKELTKKVENRDKIAMKLEGAETKLIKLSNTARLKSMKGKGPHNDEEGAINQNAFGTESGSAAARFVKPKQRPTHRIGFLGLIGKKVDTINWSRSELQKVIPEVQRDQDTHRAGEAKPMAAVFVEFYTQTEAQSAFQMVAHHQPLHMSERVIGFVPEEVVWSNLGITWKTRVIRNILTNAAVVLTIIFWAIPVAVVGAISNIKSLTTVAPFLSFINKCPPVILGVITNLLPSVMLAVLMALLPIYLRFMAKTAGLPTRSAIELRTQTSYFWFQVIQVFLITTMTSAASAAVPVIVKNPSSAPSLLAKDLPKASNFYISYFILQGLTFASGALLQIVGLILFKVLGKILGSTPRKLYTHWANLSGLGWATVFPVVTLLTVISITYSAIAPLMMGFAAIGLYLFYFAYRYNLLYVNSSNIDTKGLVYPKALQQTLVGCYLSVICLIGLFAVAESYGPLVLMIIYAIFMILFHISLNSAVEPLLHFLPRSLEAEEDAFLAAEEGVMSKHNNRSEYQNGKGMTEGGSLDSGTLNDDPRERMPPPPHKKPNFLAKFLHPDVYTDYATCRRLVPHGFADIAYDSQTEKNAYYNPAVTAQMPLLWVPRDAAGVSRQECAHTSRITPITDEGAFLDNKGKLQWDMEGTEGRPPVYEEKVYY